MARRSPALSLQAQLLLAFAALVAGTALAIVGTVERRQRAATVQLAEQLADRSRDSVIQQTKAFLGPARQTAALIAQAWTRSPHDDALDPALVGLIAGLLDVFPQLTSALVADEAGNKVGVRRGHPEAGVPLEQLVMRRVIPSPGGPTRQLFARLLPARPGWQLETVSDEITDYDPRVRPWYRAATDTGGPAWTAPYVFTTTGTPGVTAVEPVYDPDGALRGVAGADILIDNLSAFLGGQRVGAHGHTFLVDDAGRVVAHPDQAVFRDAEGAVRFPEVAALGLPGVEDALASHIGAALVQLDGGDRVVSLTPLQPSTGTPWTLVIVASTADFLGSTRAIREQATLIVVMILLVGAALSAALSRQISRPIQALAERVSRIRRFEFDNDFDLPSRTAEVIVMSRALARMQAALVSFSRYASTDLVQKLIASGEVARLGGEERVVTVLLSDLRGYTTLTETIPPTAVVEILNHYFQVMQDVIEAHQGVVLEYVGDAILVVFGAPLDLPGHEAAAVRCAAAMREALATLNAAWHAEGRWARHGGADFAGLGARIGVHTGSVVAGNLGSRTHMKYGVVGDTVNVAARLETLNKALGTDILVSGAVAAALPEDLRARLTPMGAHQLRGRGQAVEAYAIREG